MKTFVVSVCIGSAIALAPSVSRGCACGCGVFDVATSSMLPHASGGMVWEEFDYQDQYENWHANSSAPAANNGDKDLQTEFTELGLQYMFNRSWGAQIEIPYDWRHFQTTGGATGNQIVSVNWSQLGDIRLEGIYTGFSPDMSIGLTFGLKLPTGSYSHQDAYGDVDRDSELGTGSTDVLLGGFYRHNFVSLRNWTWYAQLLADIPTLTQAQYQPGIEVDAAAGVYYTGLRFDGFRITPVAQVIASERTSDHGNAASGGVDSDPEGGVDSGYQRVMLSPGIEVDWKRFTLYGDVEVPVFMDFVGNQLVARWLVKTSLTYHF